MKEEVERYLELTVFLRDPNNSNVAEEILNDVLDEMDAIWYTLTMVDRVEIDALIKQLR